MYGKLKSINMVLKLEKESHIYKKWSIVKFVRCTNNVILTKKRFLKKYLEYKQ